MNQVPATSSATEVAAPGEYNPYSAYGEQATGGTANILKFRKGRFHFGQDDTEIPLGTQLVANMPGLKVGHVRWQDLRPTDEAMVLVAEGLTPQRRNELGDLDRELWEVGDNGESKDPWQFTNHLPLKDPETGEEFLFASSSRGGIGAIGALCKVYGQQFRQKPGMLPVIELRASDYAHSNKAYGRIDVPVFELVGWIGEAELTAADGEPTEAPEPEPEPQKPADAPHGRFGKGAGQRTRF